MIRAAEYELVEHLPRITRGSRALPEAYDRAERQWSAARALCAERRWEEAAAQFLRVAEILSPTLAGGHRGEFLQARGFAYANAAIAWAAAGKRSDGRTRLFAAFERDAEAKLEIARAIELLGG